MVFVWSALIACNEHVQHSESRSMWNSQMGRPGMWTEIAYVVLRLAVGWMWTEIAYVVLLLAVGWMWTEIAYVVLWLGVGWIVQGSNPSGDDIFCAHPDRPWVPLSLLWNWYHASFPGMKWPGRGIDHPLPRSSGVKERVQLYLYSLSVSSWQVIGWTYVYL